MTLKSDLVDLLKHSYEETWQKFADIKQYAVSHGLKIRHARTWKTPGEPALVSGLFSSYVGKELAHIVATHLPHLCGLGAPIVSGVFVHQKPKVRFGSPSQEVEIGDLLFVRHHFQANNPIPQGWAFLMQAKHCDRANTGRLTGKEGVQFDLYANWNQPLTFPAGEPGPPPSGRHWNLSFGPPSPQETGSYGIVAKSRLVALSFPDQCPWAVGTATAPAPKNHRRAVDASKTSLAAVLEQFLQGSLGRPWTAIPAATDHWSHFVKAMLENAVAQQWRYTVQRVGISDALRAQTSLALLTNGVPQWKETLAGSGFFLNWWESTGLHAWLDSVKASPGQSQPPTGGPPRIETLREMQNPVSGLSVFYAATYGQESLRASVS